MQARRELWSKLRQLPAQKFVVSLSITPDCHHSRLAPLGDSRDRALYPFNSATRICRRPSPPPTTCAPVSARKYCAGTCHGMGTGL